MRSPFFITIALIGFTLVFEAHAQSNKPDKPISVQAGMISLDMLLQKITKETGYQFSYNPDLIRSNQLIKVPANKLTANQWLDILYMKYGIEHTIVGEHVILKQTGKTLSSSTIPTATKINKKNTSTKLGQAKTITAPVKNKKIPDSTIKSPPDLNKPADSIADRGVINPVKSITTKPYPENDTTRKPKLVPLNNLQDTTVTRKQLNAAGKKFPVQSISKLEAGMQGVGIAFERRLSNYFSIDISAGIGGNYTITDKLKYKISQYDLGAYLSLNPRWYYKGITSDTSPNDGGYVGMEIKYVHDITKVDFQGSVLMFNLHYGTQKYLSNRLLINAHAGPGYFMPVVKWALPYKKLYPSLDLKISYLLNAKKR